MTRRGRILIVDDDADWRKTLVETLQQNGYISDAVEDVSQALQKLSTAIYHIVVIDIRLPNNAEGIGLLQELDRHSLKEATKVIMLSGYGTMEHMRKAFKDYEVSDFLEKDKFGPQIFLESVKQVFARKAKINLELDIQWQMKSMADQVVSNLILNGKRVSRTSLSRRKLIDELEDLLCRLFHEAKMILVRPLAQGWSGAGVLLIQPFFMDGGRGQDLIVKFGEVNKIRKEHDNFQQHVQRFLRGGRSTTILDQRYSLHLGGIVYSLLGANNDELVDFADFYRDEDNSKIRDALDHLFLDTCGNWYDNRSKIQPLNLSGDYQRLFNYSPKKFEEILADELPSVHVEEKLTFTALNSIRKFTNPLSATDGLSFTCFTSTCTTHGDFNPHNLLIDQAGFTWLIDFEATEPAHILRDIAMLDSAVRFQLLREQEASLEERLQMEEVLCRTEYFSQIKQLANGFTTDNRALAKAYAIVIHLRTLAGNLVAHNQHDDISEYYIALFYNALNTLRFSSLGTVQHEHALLCASLLADRLNPDRYQRR
jgi:DNA-binding response OmpR family regulator